MWAEYLSRCGFQPPPRAPGSGGSARGRRARPPATASFQGPCWALREGASALDTCFSTTFPWSKGLFRPEPRPSPSSESGPYPGAAVLPGAAGASAELRPWGRKSRDGTSCTSLEIRLAALGVCRVSQSVLDCWLSGGGQALLPSSVRHPAPGVPAGVVGLGSSNQKENVDFQRLRKA